MQNFKKNMKEYSVTMTLNNDVQFCTFICMKGFFIKKAFFDGWDNLIGMVLLNIVYIAIFFLMVSSFALVDYGPLPFFLRDLPANHRARRDHHARDRSRNPSPRAD